MLLRCFVSSCKRQYSVSITLPTRPTNVGDQPLIAVTECASTPSTALDASVMSERGRIEVTGASIPTLSAGLLQRYKY